MAKWDLFITLLARSQAEVADESTRALSRSSFSISGAQAILRRPGAPARYPSAARGSARMTLLNQAADVKAGADGPALDGTRGQPALVVKQLTKRFGERIAFSLPSSSPLRPHRDLPWTRASPCPFSTCS